jgi:hypothetical protein
MGIDVAIRHDDLSRMQTINVADNEENRNDALATRSVLAGVAWNGCVSLHTPTWRPSISAT